METDGRPQPDSSDISSGGLPFACLPRYSVKVYRQHSLLDTVAREHPAVNELVSVLCREVVSRGKESRWSVETYTSANSEAVGTHQYTLNVI